MDNSTTGPATPAFDELARSLFDIGVIKFGEFKLKSGIISPFYFDMRCVISHPAILKSMAELYIERCAELEFRRIAGIPFTGLPIAVAISLAAGYPMVFGRREAKDYGVARRIEGTYEAGEAVLLIDDVITDGQSKLEHVDIFVKGGLVVRDIEDGDHVPRLGPDLCSHRVLHRVAAWLPTAFGPPTDQEQVLQID